MKTIWMTSLEKAQEPVRMIGSRLTRYGLKVEGHFWADDLTNLAWLAAADEIRKTRAALWLILAGGSEITERNRRYGLSLLALAVRAHTETSPPIVLMYTGASAPSEPLTTPLENATVMTTATPSWEAKLVAMANLNKLAAPAEYRLDAYGDRQLGQWFEIGPAQDAWKGAMFGVEGASINLHAVGAKGKIPDRTVLNYAQKDMKLSVGDNQYSAWTVRNVISAEDSYFVRIDGYPSSILFGPYAEQDSAELYIQRLK